MIIFVSTLALCSGYYIGQRWGLLWALAMVLGFNIYLIFFGVGRAKSWIRIPPFEGQDSWGVHRALEELTRGSRWGSPHLSLLPLDAPQALAAPTWDQRGHLVLTEGLLRILTPDETRAVLAFHVTAIRRRQMFGAAVATSILTAGLIITRLLDRAICVVIGSAKDPYSPQNSLATRTLSPLLRMLLHFTIQPQDYLRNDQACCEMGTSRHHLAQAIWKLDTLSKTLPFHSPVPLAHLFIVNPLTKRDWRRYLVSHPQIERRIHHLVGYFPP